MEVLHNVNAKELKMKRDAPPISLIESRLDRVRRARACFASEEKECRVLLPFMKHGFGCENESVHIVPACLSGEWDA